MKKILLIVTSHSDLGKTDKKTGYYLSEVSHPYIEFEKKGFTIDIASPRGGAAPMDPSSNDLNDPVNQKFMTGEGKKKLNNTQKLSNINPDKYDGIIFAGGHGTMWDFPENDDINHISRIIYENDGVVGAVCHGPAALLNIKLSNGSHLIKDKKIGGFSNAEEESIELTNVVPFSLEDELKKAGGIYECADLWQKHIVVDQRLVTGQNPASATGVANAMIDLLLN